MLSARFKWTRPGATTHNVTTVTSHFFSLFFFKRIALFARARSHEDIRDFYRFFLFHSYSSKYSRFSACVQACFLSRIEIFVSLSSLEAYRFFSINKQCYENLWRCSKNNFHLVPLSDRKDSKSKVLKV